MLDMCAVFITEQTILNFTVQMERLQLMTDNNMTRAFILVPDNTPHRHDEPKLTLNIDDINCLVNGGTIRLYVDKEEN